jgi:hypothetical protein
MLLVRLFLHVQVTELRLIISLFLEWWTKKRRMISHALKYFPFKARFTTHLSLVPRLIMSGAIPLLPLYDFMAWTGTSFSLKGNYTYSEYWRLFGELLV